MSKLEDLRKKADSGSFWKPEAGEDKLIRILDEVEIGPGVSWEIEDLVSGVTMYLPQYGNLKKKGLKKGKDYYIRCTQIGEIKTGKYKGTESRVFFVQELSSSEAKDLAEEMMAEDEIKF